MAVRPYTNTVHSSLWIEALGCVEVRETVKPRNTAAVVKMDKETLLLPRQARDRPNVNKKTTHTTQNWRRRWGWRLTQLIRILMSVQAAQREAAIVTRPWLAHERHKREIERSAAELFIIGTLHYGGALSTHTYTHTYTSASTSVVSCTQTGIAGRPEPPPHQQQQQQGQ